MHHWPLLIDFPTARIFSSAMKEHFSGSIPLSMTVFIFKMFYRVSEAAFRTLEL